MAQRSVAGVPAAEALSPESMTLGELTPASPAARAQAADTRAVAAQASGENFPVALRLLPRRYRRHLMAVYVFARTADDTGDEAPAAERLGLLAELTEDVRRLYASLGESSGLGSGEERDGGPPRLAAVRGLARTVTECEIPIQPFIDLIRANQQDQVVSRYQTFDDLAGYCKLSAHPVGQIVLHVFGCFTPARAEQSDLICTGLQLAEHWQDVAEDFRAGRIYLPLEDLAGHGCAEQDLAARQTVPMVRDLLAFEVGRARSLIDSGAPLIGSLHGAARAAVAGYVAGGRAALAAIAAADYDVLACTPRPGRVRTAAELAKAFARGG